MTKGWGFNTTEKRKYYFHHRIPAATFDPLKLLVSGLDVYILSSILVMAYENRIGVRKSTRRGASLLAEKE